MPRKPKPLTVQQLKNWEAFCDDIEGKWGPADPDDINIAFQVDEIIKMFGLEEGALHADFRSQVAFHQEDRDDWKEVARIIRERQAGGGAVTYDDLETNVERFTPEVLARKMIEQYGDQADIQAAQNADHFYAQNNEAVANIWHEATKIIRAVQVIVRAAGMEFK